MNGYDYSNYRYRPRGQHDEFILDKPKSQYAIESYQFARLHEMFHYENLPDTVPADFLEQYLLENGTCFFTKVKGDYYVFVGGFGGEPDPYYRPTIYTYANPALKISREAKIGEDGILMRNDSMWCGLLPLMRRYSALMVENLLSIRTGDILMRMVVLMSAGNDKVKLACDEYIKNILNGKLGVVVDNNLFGEITNNDGFQTHPVNGVTNNYIMQFVELQQYLTGSFYQEIGLNSNYNMKREALGEAETLLNEDSLLPLCENMLRCRREDIEKINEMYNLDIKVDFASSWKQNELQATFELENLENAANGETPLTDESDPTENENEIQQSEVNEKDSPTNKNIPTDTTENVIPLDSNESTEKEGENNISIEININTDETKEGDADATQDEDNGQDTDS